MDIILLQLFTVDRDCRYPILFANLRRRPLCVLGIGLLTVYQHQEGFPQLLQGQNGLFLRLQIITSGNFSKASVCSHHQTYGGMVVHDLIRSQLRRLCKGDLIVKPWCFHHPFHIFFHVARCSLHHIAHAVDEAHGHGNIAA